MCQMMRYFINFLFTYFSFPNIQFCFFEDELTNPAGDDDKTNESAKLYSDEEDDTVRLKIY